MFYDGKNVRKPKFNIGDTVQVKEVPGYFGKIGYLEYRHDDGAATGWFYKIHLNKGEYLTFSEGSLKKYRAKKPLHRKV